ncbi:MAG TPA: 2,3-diphosphoglycerate-dependent phosphoglycerate mutase [Candidatus Binatia bacterium]|jgi:2,3-bisphosphoglycerate-dependent phosphoglycerate mutase|nr:2,3-diphosphoglycerate-dependent phosphoglycerate mutase [Candidatus Binatia bacterium]
MAELILLRHGESQWNLENRFTGWVDVPLSPRGEAEARAAGEKLRGRRIDVLFTSVLRRATDTAHLALEVAGVQDVPTIRDAALNERMYGDLQGMNKAEAAQKFGAEQVKLWRRSYDVRPPGGESLADTAARVLPFWEARIVPELRAGKNVLVVAHGNSLRALVMHLDGLSREAVLALEIPTGRPLLYEMTSAGTPTAKRYL